MRFLLFSLVLTAFAQISAAFEIEDQTRFGVEGGAERLRIISTADIAFFEPMVDPFLTAHPDTEIEYVVVSSAELMRALQDENETFDLAISSAMDLQTKLANDGMALRHSSSATLSVPAWAVWNDMLFAFTQEPAAIVISNAGFADLPVPKDRHDLIDLLRNHPDRFRGRVGTYDVRASGLGYLFATQDTRASETYWRLTEVMGALDARLYCCSSDMIDAVASGELLIAYNVLGSYAMNRVGQDAFSIVLPTDFTTVMLRTVLIPKAAASPDLAREFVDHLLVQAHAAPTDGVAAELEQIETSLNRIRIGPGLMVFLDQLKKRAFLSEWTNAILQD
ncbi:hypothetical protein TRM7557_01985 [Tritonibacter multivorans]|uniref:ABC transporter substrate-binding protein n=1 Tax=Tritonibacter multivorans TaxID=928856 RepID=A0A0P1GVZ9_9RHOB|nr:substrate-binding domain-containing protein [Tritonibacter multivorans]CUH78661.1 hypothetical protein TRM7557_01985 [Tritonibacter multivorans]SFD66482.1 iron(III) transport system substrate-binding protein [Tritonibacter multivorans]